MLNVERPIRVVHVIARMNVGGPAWILSVVIRKSAPPEFESCLLTGSVEVGEADFITLRDPGLPHRLVPGLGRSVRVIGDLRALFFLIREMRRFRPDIVHTHTAKAGALGRVAAIVARVPVRVHTFHGHLLNGYFGASKTFLVVLVERVLARVSTSLIAVGTRVRDDLLDAKIGSPNQFVVFPPGVIRPVPIGRDEARSRVGLSDAGPVVLFAGRLTAIKRIDRLVAAFAMVLERIPKATLVVVGAGDQEDELSAMSEPLGDRVRLMGWRSDLQPFYESADVAVLTSDNEGMPVTLIEASMAGVPCVTTDVGSAREVVSDRETGFVVELTPEAVAVGLVALLEDPDLARRMGQRARERAELLFGDERLAEDHRRLYRRLLARPDVGSLP